MNQIYFKITKNIFFLSIQKTKKQTKFFLFILFFYQKENYYDISRDIYKKTNKIVFIYFIFLSKVKLL